MIRLNDFVRMVAASDLLELSTEEKQELTSTSKVEDSAGVRGLTIDLKLTHSGKRINNRIYTPRAQKATVDRWYDPVPKKMHINHDTDDRVIGRIIDAKFESLDNEAVKFFDSVGDFLMFKRIFEEGNARKIYKAMHEHNLLLNPEWPGLGVIYASAKITDSEAIDNFLSGKYVEFSAGALTDTLVCGICGSDWGLKDICEHRPGQLSKDGLPAVFIVDKYLPEEGSVMDGIVPADKDSRLLSMRLDDNADIPDNFDYETLLQDSTSIILTDACLSTTDSSTVESPVVEDNHFVEETTVTEEEIKQLLADKAALEAEVEVLRAQIPVVEDAKPNLLETVDFQLLGLATTALLNKEEVLDEEQLKGLEDSLFLGERGLPVPNEDYVAAILKVVEISRYTQEVKDALTSEVNTIQTKGEFWQKKIAAVTKNLEDLQVDYANALKTVEELQDKLAKEVVVDDTLIEDSSAESEEGTQGTVPEVEDPSIGGAGDQTKPQLDLKPFEKKVADKYQKLLTDSGEHSALHYLQEQVLKGYVLKDTAIKIRGVNSND